jgi:hypothetical protein
LERLNGEWPVISEARLADNVGGQDRRQFALLTGQWNFPALLQRIARGLVRFGSMLSKKRLSESRNDDSC